MNNEFAYQITAEPAYESPKAFGYDVVIREEATDQQKKIRVFLPKSQIRDGHFQAWLAMAKLNQAVESWTGRDHVPGACFAIYGLTKEPIM